MPLAMARPWKHPKTGIYWLRRGVPDDLRALVGKREEKRSLATRDPDEARRLHARVMAEVEQRWANLRVGPGTLTQPEAQALANNVHAGWMDRFADDPGSQTAWRPELYERLWNPLFGIDPEIPSIQRQDPFALDVDGMRAGEMEAWCEAYADKLLADAGLIVDAAGRSRLARAVATASQHACLALQRHARGEFDAFVPWPGAAPSPYTEAPTAPSGPALTFDEAIALWIAEKQPAPKTAYEWRRVVKQLTIRLGHADADRVTVDDLIAWKAELLAAGQRPKTVRDAKIAPVRAILQCAVNNRKLAANPAERVLVDVKAAGGQSRRSFTDKEAAIILKAALSQTNPVLRWVPWLCAYSGARVSEVCQLRREDVHEHDGVWCMRFAAEAGSLKNANSERAVPLHPALIEGGFLAFVRGVKSGPLFANLPPDKFGKRGGNGTKVLGRWVRELGLTDGRLGPNHSWRHRFKTLGRRYGLAMDLTNAMTGHGRRTVADVYGEYPMSALLRELGKIPAIKLD